MKRIEFIAPVEAMRGNLSGKQNLVYAENDNKAYESPVGGVNYARNYTNRFIGAKRAKDGLKYFAVKTRTATHLTAAAKRAMALLGGAGAIYASIVRDKTSQLYINCKAQYEALVAAGSTKTFRQSLMDVLRAGLVAKSATIAYAGPAGTIPEIDNPWCNNGTTINVSVGNDILVKFWDQLAFNPVTFEVTGLKGVAHTGDNFDSIATLHYNVLNLQIVDVEGTGYAKMSDSYLLDGEDYVDASSIVIANKQYGLTTETPA